MKFLLRKIQIESMMKQAKEMWQEGGYIPAEAPPMPDHPFAGLAPLKPINTPSRMVEVLVDREMVRAKVMWIREAKFCMRYGKDLWVQWFDITHPQWTHPDLHSPEVANGTIFSRPDSRVSGAIIYVDRPTGWCLTASQKDGLVWYHAYEIRMHEIFGIAPRNVI